MHNRLLKIIFAIMTLALLSTGARAEDFVAGYHIEGKFLLLGQDMRNTDGTLKPFSAMTPDEISTIYHELWHAWFLENRSARRELLHRRFLAKAERLYKAYPEDKRLEIHEEAVADFTDAVIGTTIQLRRYILTKSPERRRQLLENANIQRAFRQAFDESYTGYYTRSIRAAKRSAEGTGAASSSSSGFAWNIEDNPPLAHFLMDPEKAMSAFIADAEKDRLPVGYLREALRNLKGVVFLTDAGLPIPANPEIRVAPPKRTSNPAGKKGSPSTTATIEHAGLQNSMPSAGSTMRSSSASSIQTTTADPMSRAAGSLLSMILGGEKPGNSGPLQSDIVTSDIPLDNVDKMLVEKYLFEGRLAPDNFSLLSQE